MNVRSRWRAQVRAKGRHSLRRTLVRRRWRDETNFLLSDAHNARLLLESIAELNRWGAILDRPHERIADDAA
jgi:hypothetical protein